MDRTAIFPFRNGALKRNTTAAILPFHNVALKKGKVQAKERWQTCCGGRDVLVFVWGAMGKDAQVQLMWLTQIKQFKQMHNK